MTEQCVLLTYSSIVVTKSKAKKNIMKDLISFGMQYVLTWEELLFYYVRVQ